MGFFSLSHSSKFCASIRTLKDTQNDTHDFKRDSFFCRILIPPLGLASSQKVANLHDEGGARFHVQKIGEKTGE